MDSNQRKNLLNLLAGIGIGTIVGLSAGLLTAPKKGEELRHDLMGKASGLTGKLTGLMDQGRAAVNRLLRVAQDEGEKMLETAMAAGESAIEEVEKNLQDEPEA